MATYKAHVERVRSEASARPAREAVRTHVFAATCSGSVALGRLTGVPLAVIGMARDPDVAVSNLNARRHGACTPYGSLSQAFDFQTGWDDWRIVRFGAAMAGTGSFGAGIEIGRGVIIVSTRGDAPLADMRSSLAASLRHMRMQEVASGGGAVAARHAAGGPLVVTPRYTAVDPPACRTCKRVDDLYAFDPWTDLPWLGVTIAAAGLDAGVTFAPT